MSKQGDKIKTVRKICNAARLYKANLVGKKYLYFFDNRYIEVIYKAGGIITFLSFDKLVSLYRIYGLS